MPRERTWTFNMTAIQEFADAMGFDIPERVEFSSTFRGRRRRGSLTVWPEWDGRIRIEVAAWNDPEQANRTLIHELAHLAQFARVGFDPKEWRAMTAHELSNRHGYRNRPTEIEAREWEALAETEELIHAHT